MLRKRKFKAIFSPTELSLARLETGSGSIWLKNTSKDTWIDPKKKIAISQGEPAVAIAAVDVAELADFRLRFMLDGRNDVGFASVHTDSGELSQDQHKALPGQVVEYRYQVKPQKFALSGRSSILLSVSRGGKQYGSYLKLIVQVNSDSTDRSPKKPVFKDTPDHTVYKNKAYEEAGNLQTVVMANWARTSNVKTRIDELRQQTVPVRLIIWDNSPESKELEKIVQAADLPICVYDSIENIGGYGRFYAVKLEGISAGQPVVFVDDDQVLGSQAIQQLIAGYQPQSIGSFWSFTYLNKYSYWHKQRAQEGEVPDYLGTGGMVVDAAIFELPETFACPEEFWFAEDIWLSHIAKYECGWVARAISADIQNEDDGKNQQYALVDMKTKMFRYLREKQKRKP